MIFRVEMLEEGSIEISGDGDGLRALANHLLAVAITGTTALCELVPADPGDPTRSLTIYLENGHGHGSYEGGP